VVAIADGVGAPEEAETVFKLCEHLAANPDRSVKKSGGPSTTEATYSSS
jgi:glucose-6-phosphate isomerase